MKRYPDWEARLDRYVIEAQARPFSWGRHDCVLFALGAAEAITGVDAAANLRGTYDSARGAAGVMRRLFHARDLAGAVESFRAHWAGESVPVLMAQRGDIVLAEPDAATDLALGIVSLDGRSALFAAPKGLTRLPLRSCRSAWRVG